MTLRIESNDPPLGPGALSAEAGPLRTPPMPPITLGRRLRVVGRCLSDGCPRCAYRPIATVFSFKASCPDCGLLIDKGNGFLLGALPAAYAIFVLGWLLPCLAAWLMKLLSYSQAFALIALGAVVWPIVLFNYCKMISLSCYYFFMLAELHAPDPDQEPRQDPTVTVRQA